MAGLSRKALQAALTQCGAVQPDKAKMRAGQVWRWIHYHGVTDFSAMSNIAKEDRAALAERLVIARPEIAERQVAADGVIKWLIRFAPGVEAEDGVHPRCGPVGLGRPVRLQPGGLHAELHLLPHRHPAAWCAT